MSADFLDILNIDDYRHLIPGELFNGAKSGEFTCIGGTFMDEPAGALVCEDLKGNAVLIRSIYVEEPYRRLSVATDMMELIAGKKIYFTYEATGDRATLEPFFEAMDIYTQRLDCPMGFLTLGEIDKRLRALGTSKVPESGVTFSDLEPKDRETVLKWMESYLDERGEAYDWVHPDSVFLMEDSKVKACVLISEVEEGLLSVDLVYFEPGSNPKKLMGLFAWLMVNVQSDYDDSTKVRMLMTTEEGKKLFGKIIGDTEIIVPIVTAA